MPHFDIGPCGCCGDTACPCFTSADICADFSGLTDPGGTCFSQIPSAMLAALSMTVGATGPVVTPPVGGTVTCNTDPSAYAGGRVNGSPFDPAGIFAPCAGRYDSSYADDYYQCVTFDCETGALSARFRFFVYDSTAPGNPAANCQTPCDLTFVGTATTYTPDPDCDTVYTDVAVTVGGVAAGTIRLNQLACGAAGPGGGGEGMMARVAASASRAESIRRVKLPCVHLGPRSPNQSCGNAVYYCHLYGDTTRPAGPCPEAARTCQGCPAYVPPPQPDGGPPD